MGLGTPLQLSVNYSYFGALFLWQKREIHQTVKWRDGGFAAYAHNGFTEGLMVACDVGLSGTTITKGDTWTLGPINQLPSIQRLSDDKALFLRYFGDYQADFANVTTWPTAFTVGSDQLINTEYPIQSCTAMLDSEYGVVVYSAFNDDAKSFIFRIDSTTDTVVSVGSVTTLKTLAPNDNLTCLNIVVRDSEHFEVFWNTDIDSEAGDIEGTYGTRTGTAVSFGTIFTIKAGASYCSAARVNADHCVVCFGDSIQQQNTSAVLVHLESGSRAQGSLANFNTGTDHTGSISVASAGDDTFYIVASIGFTWQSDTTDMRLYKGTSDGLLNIPTTEEVINISTAISQTGRELEMCFIDSARLAITYTRHDDVNGHTYAVVYEIEPAGDFQITGTSLSKGVGDRLYVVGHTGTELALKVYEYPSLTLSAAYSLGSVTPAELAARTYWAAPYAPYGLDDQVYIFGRLNDPGGLGLTHLMVSFDGGANFDLITGDLGTKHVGSVIETDSWKTYCIVNKAGGAELWEYDGSDFLLLSTIPIDDWIAVHGVCTLGTNVLVACNASADPIVIYSAPPFADWLDITYDHPTANGINAIITLP